MPATLHEPAEDAAFFAARPGETEAIADARWRADVYRGDREAELTVRAILTGVLIGAVLALSNLYLGLKAGWAVTVSISASIASVSAWRAIAGAGLARPMSILEHNCMASTATACGFSTGAILMSAVPALMMISGQRPHGGWLMLWIFFAALLGIVLAIPLKRALVNRDELPFPSGTATAQTLRSLHDTASRAGQGARALFVSMLISGGYHFAAANSFDWWKLPRLPQFLSIGGQWFGRPWSDYSVGVAVGGLQLAVGGILGLRVTSWMLTGSIFSFVMAAPFLAEQGILESVGYRSILYGYSLWFGSALLVSSSLMTFLFEGRVIGRVFSGVFASLRHRPVKKTVDPIADLELPQSWFLSGLCVASIGVAIVASVGFGVVWWHSAVAIAMAGLFVMVAVRATGETDITPAGDLSKITQLTFGGIAAGNLTTNLMMASVISSTTASASDLTERQRCGRLLGANPRRMFVAQFLGVVAGSLVLVPAFYLLIPSVDLLGSQAFPAPAAQGARAIAELLSGGVAELAPLARVAFLGGCIIGVVIASLNRAFGARAWMPSAMGLGMGMLLDFGSSAGFFVGGALVAFYRHRWSGSAERHALPAGSGLIAGESLMGVLLALMAAVGWMGR